MSQATVAIQCQYLFGSAGLGSVSAKLRLKDPHRQASFTFAANTDLKECYHHAHQNQGAQFPGLGFTNRQTLTGKEMELDIEPSDKVSRIKERIEEKEGIPPVQQRIIFGGKQMADDKTAADYSIEGGTVLHLVLALRGGRDQ